LLHVAGPSPRIETRDRNLAIVRHTQSDDAFEERRLAGAVWSEETEDFAFADLQRGAAHRLYVTVRFFQAANADDVRRDDLIAASTWLSGTAASAAPVLDRRRASQSA